MSEDEMVAEVESYGLAVDFGNLISGPFIPDGRVRIYDPASGSVFADGASLDEAFGGMWRSSI